VKDNGHLYFLKYLDSPEPSIDTNARAQAAFVLAVVCDGHSKGQALCAAANLLQVRTTPSLVASTLVVDLLGVLGDLESSWGLTNVYVSSRKWLSVRQPQQPCTLHSHHALSPSLGDTPQPQTQLLLKMLGVLLPVMSDSLDDHTQYMHVDTRHEPSPPRPNLCAGVAQDAGCAAASDVRQPR
jgi:hypothetical protein